MTSMTKLACVALVAVAAPGVALPGAWSAAPQAVKSARIEGPYFSDQGGIAAHVIGAINNTHRTLDVAIYDLTERDIARALVAARRRGVRVRIVADRGQAAGPYSEISYLRSQGISVRLGEGFNGEQSLMHDKFAVFDGERAETGSFNWTASGERYNSENAVLITDSTVATRFEKEFEKLWNRARTP